MVSEKSQVGKLPLWKSACRAYYLTLLLFFAIIRVVVYSRVEVSHGREVYGLWVRPPDAVLSLRGGALLAVRGWAGTAGNTEEIVSALPS